jgi:hypothetical protein
MAGDRMPGGYRRHPRTRFAPEIEERLVHRDVFKIYRPILIAGKLLILIIEYSENL